MSFVCRIFSEKIGEIEINEEELYLGRLYEKTSRKAIEAKARGPWSAALRQKNELQLLLLL